MRFHVNTSSVTKAKEEGKIKKRKAIVSRRLARDKSEVTQANHLEEERKDREHLFALLVVWPFLWGVIFYLLCKLGIFCIVDLFKRQKSVVPVQVLELEGDYLSLVGGNTVDLSAFHEKYEAGTGLELEGNKFRLKETGVNPGIYGTTGIPIFTVDKYGRLTYAGERPIPDQGGIRVINDQYGPSIQILGYEHRIIIQSEGNNITIKTPQDIDIDSAPTFGGLHLTGELFDKNDFAGNNGDVLLSTGDGILWVDSNIITQDDQTLSWDPDTFDLSIENGNTVNLSSLAIWKQENIGGYYSTDLVTPRDSNVQRIHLGYTGWGLTELQIKNEDNSNNYSGAVLTLKGSGPDYTNNMFFAKLGDNYYVPSWAGKGVVSTDQPLIIASVKSNDPAHPNNNPYIMFQTGGYYTAPVDRMILDANGNLGIGDFNPDDKLTVAGNIHLTGSNPGVIHARNIDLELTTEPGRFVGGDIVIHPGDIGGNAGMPRSVYIYAGRQYIGWSYYTGNLILLTDRSNTTIGHLLVGVNSDATGRHTLGQFVLNNDPHYDHIMYLVRYDDQPENGAFLDLLRYRGDQGVRKDVEVGDVIGGVRGEAFANNDFWTTGGVLFDVANVTNNGVAGQIRFMVSDSNNNIQEAMRILPDASVAIGTDEGWAKLTIAPGDSEDALVILPSNSGEPGIFYFIDGALSNLVALRAAETMNDSYMLTLPLEQGDPYTVMYNDGNGNLAWESVNKLMAISVGDHAVLYSDGNNIVGDPKAFYWDYDNNKLGVNLGGGAPRGVLHVRATGNEGMYLEDASGGNYPKFAVYASCSSDPFSCPRIQMDTGAIRGTYYSDVRWSLGRDEFGSGNAGLRLNHQNGIWASGYDLHLVARNVDALQIKTVYGNYDILFDSNFDVGIATTNPTAKFQIGEAGDGTYGLANDWQTFSDIRLKTNIREIGGESALDKVLQLRGVYYSWKNNPDSSEIGFIAQEVKPVVPEVVSETADGYLTLDYSKITPLLVEAIKEQNTRINLNTQNLELVDRTLFGVEQKVLLSSKDTDSVQAQVNSINQLLNQIFMVANNILNVIKDTVFKAKVVFERGVEIMGDLLVKGHIVYEDENLAGRLIIEAGTKSVNVEFTKKFKYVPIVIVTPYSQVGGDYYVEEISTRGFRIVFERPVDHEVTLGWVALDAKNSTAAVSIEKQVAQPAQGNKTSSEGGDNMPADGIQSDSSNTDSSNLDGSSSGRDTNSSTNVD